MNKYHYLLIVLVTVYLAIMYHTELPVLLLLLEIILPLFLYILLFPMAYKLRLKWSSTDKVYEAGEEIPVKLWIENPTIFPILYLHLELVIQNMLTGEKEKREVSVMVPAKGNIQVPLGVYSEYCGKIRISLSGIRLWDYFHVFHKKKKLKEEYCSEILVIPVLTELSMEISNLVKGFLTDCDRFDPHEKGTDPAEVFQVREYQPGDRLQQIHWKLSAARDELLVKELSKPMIYPVILFLDIRKKSPWLLQQAVTDALSLLWTMMGKECPAYLVCRREDRTLQKVSFAAEEELLPCMDAVFSGIILGSKGQMLAEFEEQLPGERYAHLYYVTDHMEESEAELLAATPLAVKKTVLWIYDISEKKASVVEERCIEYGIELVSEAEGGSAVKEHHWMI